MAERRLTCYFWPELGPARCRPPRWPTDSPTAGALGVDWTAGIASPLDSALLVTWIVRISNDDSFVSSRLQSFPPVLPYASANVPAFHNPWRFIHQSIKIASCCSDRTVSELVESTSQTIEPTKLLVATFRSIKPHNVLPATGHAMCSLKVHVTPWGQSRRRETRKERVVKTLATPAQPFNF